MVAPQSSVSSRKEPDAEKDILEEAGFAPYFADHTAGI